MVKGKLVWREVVDRQGVALKIGQKMAKKTWQEARDEKGRVL